MVVQGRGNPEALGRYGDTQAGTGLLTRPKPRSSRASSLLPFIWFCSSRPANVCTTSVPRMDRVPSSGWTGSRAVSPTPDARAQSSRREEGLTLPTGAECVSPWEAGSSLFGSPGRPPSPLSALLCHGARLGGPSTLFSPVSVVRIGGVLPEPAGVRPPGERPPPTRGLLHEGSALLFPKAIISLERFRTSRHQNPPRLFCSAQNRFPTRGSYS